ncbi:hypothetical protein ACWIUD_08055 [Helicobacter sp. 23-1044]
MTKWSEILRNARFYEKILRISCESQNLTNFAESKKRFFASCFALRARMTI